MKRFVIILLALLSGLSVPQAVAAATGQGDARVIAAPLSARLGQPGEEQNARVAEPVHRLVSRPQMSGFEPDFAPAVPTVRFGDRARE